VNIHVIYRVNQAEYVIRFLVAAPQEYVNTLSTSRVQNLHKRNRQLLVSQQLAFTRYCHRQYRMVYGIEKRGRWGGVYCAVVVQ